jgi:Uma2 family endonuclease
MSIQTLVPIEEYLNTSYSPDREYRDGVLVERNLGTEPHSWLQSQLAHYFNRRRRQWKIRAYTELRIKIRADWYPIPDVCVYPEPVSKGGYPSTPPLLWIEILSPDDRMVDVWERANELLKFGVPYVWIINPETLESELRTAAGVTQIKDKALTIPETPIVIPLNDVLEE